MCVLLHGADTQGGSLLGGFRSVLPDHASSPRIPWLNICREDSKAPASTWFGN